MQTTPDNLPNPPLQQRTHHKQKIKRNSSRKIQLRLQKTISQTTPPSQNREDFSRNSTAGCATTSTTVS